MVVVSSVFVRVWGLRHDVGATFVQQQAILHHASCLGGARAPRPTQRDIHPTDQTGSKRQRRALMLIEDEWHAQGTSLSGRNDSCIIMVSFKLICS